MSEPACTLSSCTLRAYLLVPSLQTLGRLELKVAFAFMQGVDEASEKALKQAIDFFKTHLQ